MMYDEYNRKIKDYEAEFVKFMGIDSFPEYIIHYYTIDTSELDSKGYGFPAQADYDFDVNKHTLKVCVDLPLTKHTVFHEFTHILDNEMYSKGDKNIYGLLYGFTEYHASQIQLMCLIGAETIKSNIRKNINDHISLDFEEYTIGDFVKARHNLVLDVMSQESFPDSFETLRSTFGMIYNYFGFRSICRMHVDGYEENVNNSLILKYMPTNLWIKMNAQMDGWLDCQQIFDTFQVFYNAFIPIVQKYRLK